MRRALVAAALVGGVAGAEALHMRRLARDPKRLQLEDPPHGRDLTLTSADGTCLHAEAFGPESGQTVILVHGWTETIAMWIYVIPQLVSRGFRVVGLDLRGHGGSDPAASDDYSLARFGADVEAVVDSCVPEGEHAVLAGHSLGAMSIVAWAEHHEVPRRVGAVGLLNTGIENLVAEHLVLPVPRFAKALNEALSVRLFLGAPGPVPRYSTPISHFLTRHVAFGPTASPAEIAFYERMMARCSWRVRADSGIAMSRMELRHALPRLTVPTLVMAGDRDRLTPPSHAERIASELPELHRLVVLPQTGHMAPLERPGETVGELVELAAAARGTRAVAA